MEGKESLGNTPSPPLLASSLPGHRQEGNGMQSEEWDLCSNTNI